MTKTLCVMITTVLLVSGAAVAWGTEANYYNEGNTGFTEATAYIIDSVEDFNALADRVNNGQEPEGRYYKLDRNLEVSSTIGDYENKPFTGHFDGGSNRINKNINGSASTIYRIFGYIDTDGVAIKNLQVSGNANIVYNLISGTIQDCYVESAIDAQGWYSDCVTGGISSIVSVNGTIQNCRFSGNITAHYYPIYASRISYAGGIAGRIEGGTVENCKVRITDAIYAYSGESGGSDVGQAFAGGIVGEANQKATIKNNHVVGTIRSKQWAGGIVGYMHGGTLTGNSVHSVSAVEGNFAAGGIAGYLGGSAEASGNAIVLDSRLSAVSRAVGGVIGQLNQATVKNNRAYTTITGRAAYKGKIIGEIVDSPNTIEGNYYSVDGAEYVIGYDSTLRLGSNNGGTQHDPETIEDIQKDSNNSGETPSTDNTPSDNKTTDGGKTEGDNGETDGNGTEGSEDSEGSSSDGGSSGGCNPGFGILGLMAAVIALRRK